MRVLLVKLTSMGDLIHALPAITDAAKNIPGIQFDWVIDENFSEVATWHYAVKDIIKTAHRRWRENPWAAFRDGEYQQLFRKLREVKYDYVIDGQGNFKSATITRLARGLRCGMDKHSVREKIAHFAYQKKVFVDKGEHAINRLRCLFSQVLGYQYKDSPPDFAIDQDLLLPSPIELPDNYLVFIHNASWSTKWWPEPYWEALISRASSEGYVVLLPWGNKVEHARAKRLSETNDAAILLPHTNISETATIVAGAKGAVCVDTGLGHLTAALDIPAVNLYGATDPGLIGAAGDKQIHLHATFPCAPCYHKKCIYKGESQYKPACFEQLTPELVWEKLQGLL